MRLLATGLGLLALLVGLVWMGQGSGLFPYPASSFMVNDRSWIVWGAVLGAAGVAAILFGRRS